MCINVMIADDHQLMREGIKQLLEFDGSIKVIAEAGDGEDCIRQLRDKEPDVLLLDINMPKKNGVETLWEIHERKMKVKVLILTVHNEVEYLVKAVDLGVDGYILKDSGSEELKKAIHAVMRGESYIQPELIPSLNARLISRDVDQEKILSLTRRERDILLQVAGGNFNKEIATNLDISERTVKNHISSIFRKLDVSDRTQAAVFAIRNNLVKL